MNLILETERLLLRPLELSDAKNLFDIKCFPNNITVKCHPNANTLNKCIDNIEAVIEDYKEFNVGRLAVVLKKDNSLIGFAGIRFNPDVFGNDLKGFFDFDYSIKDEYQNKDYLYELISNYILSVFEKTDVGLIYSNSVQIGSFEYETFKKLHSKEIGHYNKNSDSTFFRITRE